MRILLTSRSEKAILSADGIKMPQCKNKWDFKTDKLPEATYDEDGYVTDFVETKLYAKWIKNS